MFYKHKLVYAPTFILALLLFFCGGIYAQSDLLNFYLPGVKWGMTRSELAENRPIDITVSGNVNNSGDNFFTENLDAEPIVKVDYGFRRPDSLGLLSIALTCIDQESALNLAKQFSGSEISNGSGIALKLSDGSGFYLTLQNEKLFLQWRPLIGLRYKN